MNIKWIIPLFLISLFFVNSYHVKAADSSSDNGRIFNVRTFLKENPIIMEAYKKFRQEKKATGSAYSLREDNFQNDIFLCIECPQTLPLIEDMNAILKKMADQNDSTGKEIQKSSTFEKINSLRAMYIVTKFEDSKTSQMKCAVRNISSNDPRIDQLNTVFIRSFDMDMDKIKSIQMTDGTDKIYYYKGKLGDEDIIVKVEESETGLAQITLYKIDSNNLASTSTPQRMEFTEKSGTTSSPDIMGGMASLISNGDQNNDHINLQMGAEVETGRSYIPKGITLLRGDFKQSFNDHSLEGGMVVNEKGGNLDLALKQEADKVAEANLRANERGEINYLMKTYFDTKSLPFTDDVSGYLIYGSSEITALAGFKDSNGNEAFRIKGTKKPATTTELGVTVPFNTDLSIVKLNGEVTVSNKAISGESQIIHNGENLGITRYNFNYDKSHSEVKHQWQSISVEYIEDVIDGKSNQSAWVRYSTKF